MTIQQRFFQIKENVDKICDQCDRDSQNVKIIAVTKTRTYDEINEAIKAGATAIGENRVQELLEKYDYIDKSAEIHLIGQLQTNKVKYVGNKVALIHSLDRVSLAEELNKFCIKNEINEIKTLVEVNIGVETTKSGILPNNLSEYLDNLMNFRYIKPIGLMTVAPATATEYEQNMFFEKMRELLEIGKSRFGKDFIELSMGMSRDYETAIKQGSTMIRIGTALFGERNYNKMGDINYVK